MNNRHVLFNQNHFIGAIILDHLQFGSQYDFSIDHRIYCDLSKWTPLASLNLVIILHFLFSYFICSQLMAISLVCKGSPKSRQIQLGHFKEIRSFLKRNKLCAYFNKPFQEVYFSERKLSHIIFHLIWNNLHHFTIVISLNHQPDREGWFREMTMVKWCRLFQIRWNIMCEMVHGNATCKWREKILLHIKYHNANKNVK